MSENENRTANSYQEIRQNRTYRTLGKMTWWRVVIGLLLLLGVFLISGMPSQWLAARGHYRAARTLMIAPGWMERYKPDTKLLIEAGAACADGDYESAYGIATGPAAASMIEKNPEPYRDLCEALYRHYEQSGSEEHCRTLQLLLDDL